MKPTLPIILALSLLTLISCAPRPNPTITPAPPGVVAAMNADSTILALGTVSKGVEAAADQHLIPLAEARQVLDILKGAVVTIQQVPSGWTSVAAKALDEIDSTVSPSTKTIVDPYILTARIALGLSGS